MSTATVLLDMISGFFGWYPEIMNIIEIIASGATLLLAVILFFGQARKRRQSDQALRNLEARVSSIVESAMDAIITVD